MEPDRLALVAAGILAVALLYSAVGQAGASGYLAVMSLAGLAPELIKPTALALNIAVAAITSWQFARAGHFSWPLFWPFAALAVPFAFLGGVVPLPSPVFELLVGLCLIAAAAQLLVRSEPDEQRAAPSRAAALALGGGIGLLAGLTGIGGGIFLTPILLARRWASLRTAAAVSALFILVNSTAALLGNLGATRAFPPQAWMLLAAAILGGVVGSHLGSARLPQLAIRRTLSVVLLLAGSKLVFAR
jgi:hypothetical protein